jgi:thermitase
MHRAIRGALTGAVVVTLTAIGASAAAAADAPYVPNEVIVKYKKRAAAKKRAVAADRAGVVKIVSGVKGLGSRVVRVKGDPAAVAARLNRSPAVAYAEPNFMFRATATPNDPRYPEMWGLSNTGQTGGTVDADIDAPEGWTAAGLDGFPSTGGAKVGIVDTGIQQAHAEFAGGRVSDCGGVNNFGVNLVVVIVGADPTIVDGKCGDDNGHGTHVAGTVAANTNNGVGVAGVAFRSPLAICKALNSSGSGTLVMIANCITWLNQHGAKVISMSLGGSSGSATLQQAVRNATNGGSLVIAAAGNGGNSTPNYPAFYPEVVSVAATDHNDAKASFSTFNNDVEVAAPGVNILSTWNNGGYNTISGTSMATPHASGVAAVIAGSNPSCSVAEWRAKLDASVDDKGAPGRDPNFGFGRVNLVLAATGSAC